MAARNPGGGARRARKEGLPPKPRGLNYALLSQSKNMIRLCQGRSVDKCIRDTFDVLQECLEPELIEAQGGSSPIKSGQVFASKGGITNTEPHCSCDQAKRVLKDLKELSQGLQVQPKVFKFVVCNSCQSLPFLTILVPLPGVFLSQ